MHNSETIMFHYNYKRITDFVITMVMNSSGYGQTIINKQNLTYIKNIFTYYILNGNPPCVDHVTYHSNYKKFLDYYVRLRRIKHTPVNKNEYDILSNYYHTYDILSDYLQRMI
ncbi:hypothetical protein DMUE_0001 [Dictyocoela muelleri]|nr:hypothetical protein DMUE_0001 [Dictyocoela muelleri]